MCGSCHKEKDKKSHNETKKHKNAVRIDKRALKKFKAHLDQQLDLGRYDSSATVLISRIERSFTKKL